MHDTLPGSVCGCSSPCGPSLTSAALLAYAVMHFLVFVMGWWSSFGHLGGFTLLVVFMLPQNKVACWQSV
jgi:hypothetical protein